MMTLRGPLETAADVLGRMSAVNTDHWTLSPASPGSHHTPSTCHYRQIECSPHKGLTIIIWEWGGG